MCKFLNPGDCNTIANKTKKLETLDTQGFQASHFSDSDWARTSDLHPVKVRSSRNFMYQQVAQQVSNKTTSHFILLTLIIKWSSKKVKWLY
ncbi:hypothetical protein NP92_04305 [Anoxybacillus gonensis]|nr:hypothetical protein AFK25_03875 [Anoxybacillus gonensis]KGP61618.1 hypothetical protein NP92_04305 [Anoxybacillus gonensis]